LLGFELAIEGFDDPILEDVAEAGLNFAKDEAQAGWPGVKDYRFGLKRFSGIVNLEQYSVLRLKGGGCLQETAHQADLCDVGGEHRFRRTLRSDFGVCVEGKS
jgi:hypothetical protein